MNKKQMTGIGLLIVGLILLSIPLYAEWSQHKQVQALENALAIVHEQDGTVKKSREMPFSKEQLKNVMELEIPAIKLKEKVLDETNEENLSIALTQIKRGQIPEKGNFAIAGHRGYRGNRHFRQLPDVSAGDEVILHTAAKTYNYVVTEKRVVASDAVDVLADRKGKQEITLVTCTIDGKKRIAVTGELRKDNK